MKTDVGHIISVQDLLLWGNKNEAFCKEAGTKHPKIKLLRHSDDRKKVIDGVTTDKSLYYLYREEPELFAKYQNEQQTKLFENVNYIVSFLGEEGITARFIGIYKNCGGKNLNAPHEDRSIFDFQKIDGYTELENKLIIEWPNARSWHQYWDKEKYVIRIDRGLTENGMPVFTSYEDVLLSYSELQTIYKSKGKNFEWKSRLEACNCIYLILDKSNGKQYVGSTYSSNRKSMVGIWKRWAEYAETGHGGNKSLEALCTKDPQYHVKNFQWTILEVLPLNVAPLVAIERESFYKKKFGTAEPNGYNNN